MSLARLDAPARPAAVVETIDGRASAARPLLGGAARLESLRFAFLTWEWLFTQWRHLAAARRPRFTSGTA